MHPYKRSYKAITKHSETLSFEHEVGRNGIKTMEAYLSPVGNRLRHGIVRQQGRCVLHAEDGEPAACAASGRCEAPASDEWCPSQKAQMSEKAYTPLVRCSSRAALRASRRNTSRRRQRLWRRQHQVFWCCRL